MEWSLQIPFTAKYFYKNCLELLESISLADIEPTCTDTKNKQSREESQLLCYTSWGKKK